MSKYESEPGGSQDISVSEDNGRDTVERSESPLVSPPYITEPKWGAEVGNRPTLQVGGHARHRVQIRDAHTLEALSAEGLINDHGAFNLIVNKTLAPGPHDVIVELWSDGQWAMATKILRLNVSSGKDSADITHDESELWAPGAGENPESHSEAMWGFTRPYFSNAHLGMRIEEGHTFHVGGHARSWKWIEDAHTGEQVSEGKLTDHGGGTNLKIIRHLGEGVHDLRVRMEGLGSWYMCSPALRVVVLPPPRITHPNINQLLGEGIPGADIELHQAGVGSFHGKTIVYPNRAWEIRPTGVHKGMEVTCRQRLSTVKYVENTYSDWSNSILLR
ncbi:hypothetical protein EMIT0P44_30188 [Pseudomonas sp. IT-P44]|jgi:hypothetical protein|uniref:hypothetical protein n=2 Tax=unclassified Pseudomonas TaxID=196821 RepID=UPI00178299D2|nr:hypothetical protein [Pseudomonas sp. PDM02]MBD9613838.1 hypothetical protein [Pseudomonas sp. PDM02]